MFDLAKIVYELREKMDRIFPPKNFRDSAPTEVPSNSQEQFVLYKNGTTYRLYIFIDGEWYYVDLTKS